MVVILINKIISSIMQIILFSFIPLIWWLVIDRKKESFLKWIGLKKIKKESKKKLIICILLISISYILVSFVTIYLTKDIETATSEFNGMRLSALFPALVLCNF